MTQDNKPINSHVEEYLDYYCNLSHAPGFAVLLKGQWGAGKTWFIEQYCKKHSVKQPQKIAIWKKPVGLLMTEAWRKLFKKDPIQPKKFLYVSLYGLETLSAVDDAIFQELHPFWASEQIKVAGNILKGLIKGSLKIDLNDSGKDTGSWDFQIPDIPRDPDKARKEVNKRVLVFDDLERCAIDISNLLGYINQFVEHQKLKVIILANEEKVIKLCSEYNTIKEKLIGKTFSISPDFKSAFNKFISRVEDEALKRFLSDNTELIKDLYTRSEYENLRNLSQAILEYERLFKSLPEKVKNKPELLQDLWSLLMVFSIEIKRGRILPTDISKMEETWVSKFNGSQAQEETTSLQKNLDRIGKYFSFDKLLSPFPNSKWWEVFFDKGLIDILELEQSLLSSKYFQDENTPDWIKLWHYTDLTDDEFENLLEKVEGKYDRREFLVLGEIIHVTGLFLMFSDVGIYQKSKEEILKNSTLCIDDFTSENRSSSIYKSVFSDIFLGRSYANLGFAGKDLEEFKEFYAHIAKAQEVAKKDYLQEAGQDLLEIMQSDTRKFSRMLSIVFSQEPYDHIYYRVPILQSIKPEDFIERLLTMKQEDQRSICETLSKRFESPPEEILEELTWLKSVQTLLIKEADSKKGKLSGYLLESLSKHYLENAIERVSAKSLEGKEL